MKTPELLDGFICPGLRKNFTEEAAEYNIPLPDGNYPCLTGTDVRYWYHKKKVFLLYTVYSRYMHLWMMVDIKHSVKLRHSFIIYQQLILLCY